MLCFAISFTYIHQIRELVDRNRWTIFIGLFVGLVAFGSMAAWRIVRHTSPLNYILLSIFTISEGFLVGMSTLFIPSALVIFVVK